MGSQGGWPLESEQYKEFETFLRLILKFLQLFFSELICGIGCPTHHITSWQIPPCPVEISLRSYKGNRSVMFLLTQLQHFNKATRHSMTCDTSPSPIYLFLVLSLMQNIPSYYFTSQIVQPSRQSDAEPRSPLHLVWFLGPHGQVHILGPNIWLMYFLKLFCWTKILNALAYLVIWLVHK